MVSGRISSGWQDQGVCILYCDVCLSLLVCVLGVCAH